MFFDFFHLTKWRKNTCELLETIVGNYINFMGVNVITFGCIL